MGEHMDSAYVAAEGVILFYEDDDISLNIPDSFGDMSVHTLGDGAFMESKDLEIARIPYGIKRIGKKCFNRCVTLKKVSFPGSVEEIGEDSFSECQRLRNIYIYDYEISEERYNELKSFSRCANGTVYIALSFPEGRLLTDTAIAAKALPANNIRDSIPRLITVDKPDEIDRLNDFRFNGCFTFDGGKSYSSERYSIKELLEDEDYGPVDTDSEAKNDQFIKDEKEPSILKTSIFMFDDSKTKHEDGKCRLLANIHIGYHYWQSKVKVIVDGKVYYIYRKNFLSSSTNLNYVRRDINIYTQDGNIATEKEASKVCAKYKMLSIL